MSNRNRIPNTSDPAAIQKFFLEEVQLGEDALTQGDYESTVKHLTNAITVCGQPQQLLQLFQTTLPEHVFKMLLDNIQGMKKKTEEGESLD